jgi:gluconolactonase
MIALAGIAAEARQAAGVQGPQDPRYAEVIAACTNPPAGRGGGARGGAGARGGGEARGGAPGAPDDGDREYTVTAIPGVVAAGARWTQVWDGTGNNADGIVGAEDGGLLMAQNDNSRVVKLDQNGELSTVYPDTRVGGALSISSTGAVFVAERALNPAIRQLAPENRVLADRSNGDPLDCIGGVLNDLVADSKGGVYFTMGGLFYAAPNGEVTRYGENLNTNGVTLSPDEQTLYVTNGGTVAAFDLNADGSLSNQREFVALQNGGGGDGLAVDAAGRLYVTGQPGVHVIDPDGTYVGLIPTPQPVITAAFSGPGKRTLYAVANNRTIARVFTIPTEAAGYSGRPK